LVFARFTRRKPSLIAVTFDFEKRRASTSNPDMGGYSDFCMNQPADGKTVAGVCHARGENANLPPQWLIDINVANLKRSLAACSRRVGKVVCPTREMGSGKMVVIRDSVGAVAALFEHKAG